MAKRRRGAKPWRLPNPKVLRRMDVAALCATLPKVGDEVPPTLTAAIVDRGAAATPPLVALLRDRELWWRQVVDETPTPIAAARLLAQIGDPAALAPMLGVLIDTAGLDDWNALNRDVLHAIRGFGAAALEPTLAALPSVSEDVEREAVLAVLAALGVHDMRIHFLLLEQLRTEPELGAENLVGYADPEGSLEALQEALAALAIRPATDDEPNGAFIEIAWAIDELGGQLDDEQESRLLRVHHIERERSGRLRAEVEKLQIERAAFSRTLSLTRATIGRNQACWCGSGKKYKRCHWAVDHRPTEP